MASHNHHLQSAAWLDQGGMPGGGDMTSYIRRYATYLNEKRDAYKLMGYDFCKIKRGKEDGVLRTMSTEKVETRSFIDVILRRFSAVKNVADPSETTRRRALIRRKNQSPSLSLPQLVVFLGDLEWIDESRGEQLFLFAH